MIILKVKITYKDDTSQEFESYDAPILGGDYVTIFPIGSHLGRIITAREGIARLEYDYICKNCGVKSPGSSERLSKDVGFKR